MTRRCITPRFEIRDPLLAPRVRALLAGSLNALVGDFAKHLNESGYLVRGW